MAEMSALVGRVARCLRALGQTEGGLVLAVSGGPDSVALLRAVAEARDRDLSGPLVIAHLNHMLRGPDSDADAEFVVGLAVQLQAAGTPNVRVCSERIDVTALARCEGVNLEAVARRERYRWLAEVACGVGAHWVLTGHTAGDQAETVLHHLLRGAGLQGLRGIAPQRALAPGVSLARPLLQTTRTEVLNYLGRLGQHFREDHTNRDLNRTRNRIRHELLPLLACDYNPAVVAVLVRLAAQAEEVLALEEPHARALLQNAELPRAGRLCVFDRGRLAAAPRQRVREALRLLWEREAWSMGEMGFVEWDRLAGLVWGERTAADLPGGIHARCRPHVLLVGRSR